MAGIAVDFPEWYDSTIIGFHSKNKNDFYVYSTENKTVVYDNICRLVSLSG